MDRLDSMRIFVRVAELGSFSAVARQMEVARSVVTRQVAALEAQLGVKLIVRSTRSLALTSAGEAYLARCREILDLVDAAEDGLAEEGAIARGHLRISVPLSFGLRHLVPLMLDFERTYPEISLDLDFTDRPVNLIEEAIDLAIRITGNLDPHNVARRIGSSRLMVLASPDYLKRHGEPSHPLDLADHECLMYLPSQGGGWTFMIDGRPTVFPVRGRLRANNGDGLVEAAARGLGITCQPSFIAASAIEAGRLRVILDDYPMPELGIYAVFPSNRFIPHRVRLLVDYLIERIGSRPYWERD
jgi:DNA-binding transcriptional LysR family regulator